MIDPRPLVGDGKQNTCVHITVSMLSNMCVRSMCLIFVVCVPFGMFVRINIALWFCLKGVFHVFVRTVLDLCLFSGPKLGNNSLKSRLRIRVFKDDEHI